MKIMKTLKLKEWAKRTAIGRWSASLLIAAGIQTMLLPSLHAASTKMEITDDGITTAVEDGLARAKGVLPNNVDVSTSEGIVTLAGSVENLPDKERVIKTAKSVRGVRGVIDQLTVYALARPQRWFLCRKTTRHPDCQRREGGEGGSQSNFN